MRYAEGAPAVFTMTIALDTAKVNERINVGGSSIWVAETSDIAAKMTVKLNHQRGGNGFPLQRGTLFSGVRFEYLFVDSDAQAGKWLTLVICDRADITINNPDQSFASVGLSKATGMVSPVDVTITAGTAVVVLAADSTRRKAAISNLNANAEILRIGTTTAAADHGIELAPGETIEIDSTAAIWAYNPGVADQDVGVVYTTD
jgi:hypothetical protein